MRYVRQPTPVVPFNTNVQIILSIQTVTLDAHDIETIK